MGISGSAFLLEVFGGVALLLWGTHVVTSGVMKGYGSIIKKTIGGSLRSRTRAFFTGLGVTLALQSSTATGLMAASFAATGLLSLLPGFMLMLGANVGTAIVARMLAFPIHFLAPLLMIAGVFGFRAAKRSRQRNLARVILGLGMMLLSLRMLVETLHAVPSSPLLMQAFEVLAQQPVMAILVGALAAWVCHSSVAVILLVMSLSVSGGIPLAAGLGMVLGANLGGAMGPVLEAPGLQGRRLPLANLLVRAAGVAGGAVLIPFVAVALERNQWAGPTVLVDAHVAFNIALALVFAPLARPVCALLMRWMPDPVVAQDASMPRHINKVDPTTSDPSVFIAAAERETLRLADLMAEQLRNLPAVIEKGDHDANDAISSAGDDITVLGARIRGALSMARQRNLSDEMSQRMEEMSVFALSLEQSADIVAHQVCYTAMRRHADEGAMRREHSGWLCDQARILAEAHEISVAVFIRRDLDLALKMVDIKMQMRQEEHNYLDTRPADHSPATAIRPELDDDLRILRDLRRVCSEQTSLAYLLLERGGKLRSRVIGAG